MTMKPDDPPAPATDLAAMMAAVEAAPVESPVVASETPEPAAPAQFLEIDTGSGPTAPSGRSHEMPSETWEPEHPNWVLERTDSQTTPLPDFACKTCPVAVWLTGSAKLLCFCTVMRVETWSTGAPQHIQFCTAKEMAVLAKQDAEAAREMAVISGPEEP
ncbi:MAG: hypothetical protein ACRYG8_17120 [Janthinobacterium lividum]